MTLQGPFEGELERAFKLAEDVVLRQSLNGPFSPVKLDSDEILLLGRGVIFLTQEKRGPEDTRNFLKDLLFQ